MQSRDNLERVMNAEELDNKEDLKKKLDKEFGIGAKSVTVGIVSVGDTFKIHNLE